MIYSAKLFSKSSDFVNELYMRTLQSLIIKNSCNSKKDLVRIALDIVEETVKQIEERREG